MNEDYIKVINACENNLKNISLSIPHGVICGVCGVSGSGKSTLAKEVIAKTGIMNFAEGLPVSLKRKVINGKHPDVLEVRNLPPVYMVDVKNANKNSRSTVATVSGLMGIIRNIYCTCSKESLAPRLFSYNINEENGGGACGECNGTGKGDFIDVELLIANKKKGILDGGFGCVNNKGIKNTKVTEKFIEAFCKKKGIALNSSLCDLNDEELELLLYGSDEIVDFTDRSGANNGKKSLAFRGIVNELLDVYKRTQNASISKYIIYGKCNACLGTRYNRKALEYTYLGKNISDFLSMSIKETVDFIKADQESNTEGLRKEYLAIATELIEIGVGYLELNRAIANISGGELQRIKLAKCIASDVYNCCFILDEPSTGLHSRDIDNIINTLNKLKSRGNTVIVVEHNLKILKNCDYIVEMGEKGGVAGGKVIFSGNIIELLKKDTKTSMLLQDNQIEMSITDRKLDKWITLSNINKNNVKNETLSIPLNAFTTVIGPSGSGKSSAVNDALYSALTRYIEGKEDDGYLKIDGRLKKVISLSQEQNVTNSRSLVATYLDLMDEIRDLYASLSDGENSYDKSCFSLINGKGLCPECGGTGYIKDEDGETEEICPVCLGKRFNDNILKIQFKGLNISDFLHSTIEELCSLLDGVINIDLLECCKEIGIGYLTLDRPMPSLSKGEYQRVRIAKEIADKDAKDEIIILDEPSKGLHIADADRIVSSISKLIDQGNTVVAIEHNLNVIEKSDYIIEFGPGAGIEGGKIVYSGDAIGLKESNTATSKAMSEDLYVKQNDKIMISDDINISYKNDNIRIQKNRINEICGGIGSGKSILADKGLFAYPFKKYMSLVNVQGKYLTRDIEAISLANDSIPLSRLISPTKKFFGKYERVAETLNLDYYISKLFYNNGYIKCQECGEYSLKVGRNNSCEKCGYVNDYIIHQNAFAYGKKSCKCPVCNGKGRITAYDFDSIMRDYRKELYDLLLDRTRYERIAPLLKEKYEIDIKKDYELMTLEEKRVFLYGDKKREVLYKPKKKTYVWSGCNELINTNIKFSNSERFKTKCSESYISRVCPECLGMGFESDILEVVYNNVKFEDFISASIHDAYSIIKNGIDNGHNETKKILEVLALSEELGLGSIRLDAYSSELELGERAIIQYIKYLFLPLRNTALIWDDFSVGMSAELENKVVLSLKETVNKGCIVILLDKDFKIDDSNRITLKSNYKCEKSNELEYSNIKSVFSGDGFIDRNDATLYSRTNILSVTGITSSIREVYTKKNNAYSYSHAEYKCKECGGNGYYEINYGTIGMQKHRCESCGGTGFNSQLNDVVINGYSYPYLVNASVDEVYKWAKECNVSSVVNSLELFREIGLGYVKVNQGINNMSYNECSIVLLIKMIRENKGKELKYKNLFINLLQNEYDRVFNCINQECIKNNCTILLLCSQEGDD